MTQKQIILEYLKDFSDWQLEYKIRDINTKWGFIGARGDRDVRDLIKSGKIESSMRGKFRIVKAKVEVPIAGTVDSRTEKIVFRPDYLEKQKLTKAKLL